MILQEFTLSFDQNQWVCYNKTSKFHGNSLDEIDEKIEHYLKKKFKEGFIKVAMFFDFDQFPDWHRQYMPHYFNRNWTLNLHK